MSTLVDELAYLIETPKDERPRISCLGGEWILIGRAMGGRNAIFEYQEREEKHSLYTPWHIEGAARANGYLIEEFRHLPKYQQRGMLLEQKRRERR